MKSPQKKVLIVDDEENARLGLSMLLSREGYAVDSAADGEAALLYLGEHRVHLVITDLNMPGMDGLAFLRELHRRFPSVAVVMITAFGEVESYLEAMNLGAVEYLHKPIRAEELSLVMNKIFAARSSAAARAAAVGGVCAGRS